MDTRKKIFVMVFALAAVSGISFAAGILCGFFLKGGAAAPVTVNVNIDSPGGESVGTKTVTVDSSQGETKGETAEKPEKRMVQVSPSETEKLKKQIEKDEADYGDNYQQFTHPAYKQKPDRIVSKIGDQDGFHIYEKTDAYYAHLLEVAEDRMFYSTCEDYNLWCFTPDSVETMMTSGENYIIFDYDDKTQDETGQKSLVFRFTGQTRLYRLALYLSWQTELIPREELPKKEFASDTTVSGYKYMYSISG